MPSPFGHALSGVLTAWLADLAPGAASPRTAAAETPRFARAGAGLALSCAVLAASPDIDLLFGNHRTITHSLGAVAIVACMVAGIAAWRGVPLLRLTLTCTAAYASHLLLDWMAIDDTPPRGLQLLWPLDHRFYISGWNLFWPTERRHIFTTTVMKMNAGAVLHELLILMPVVAAVWLIRVKTFARFATEISRRNHPPQ